MLGATQSVDMISSLKQDYGSVEVSVLNVDLLPNSIDTAVIGDRLFTLPIQVEGLEVNNLHGNQMDLDEGNAGGDRSMEERNASQGNVNPSQGKGNKPNSGGPSQQDGAPSRDKRVVDMGVVVQHGEGIHASVLAQEEINSNLNAGNSVNLNQQINTVNASISVQHNHQILSRADQENNEAFNMIVTSPSRGATLDIEGMELGSFSPDVNKSGIGLHPEFSGTNLQLAKPSHQGATPGNHNVMEKGSSMVAKEKRFVLENTIALAVKRSRRRGGSVDEESSERAERLKAKKNVDDPGMSKTKSFLSFSDSKIVSNIATLGVSIGKGIGRNIEYLKANELDRLLQASHNTPKQEDMGQNVDVETSEVDSAMGLDRQSIKHLVGDIAVDVLRMEEAQWSDFKTIPRKPKSGSIKMRKGKKKLKYHT
jgi:hypothetical protein